MKTCEIKRIDEMLSLEIAADQRSDNVIEGKGKGNRASMVNRKAWKSGSTISIQIMNGTDKEKGFIQAVASEWLQYANLKFEWTNKDGIVRVALGDNGSWSMMGTDCLSKKTGNTMELGWLDRSVVLHEFGHMLGLNHSHNALNFPYNFNREAVIADLSGPPNNWNVSTIEYNVLQRTREGVTETPWEEKSVMNYDCPASWIVQGVAIKPGTAIADSEANIMKQIYPPGTSIRRIMIGESIKGRGNSEYELIVSSRGIYQSRITPRSAKVYVNGKTFTLKSLTVGTYRVNVVTQSDFNLAIRQI